MESSVLNQINCVENLRVYHLDVQNVENIQYIKYQDDVEVPLSEQIDTSSSLMAISLADNPGIIFNEVQFIDGGTQDFMDNTIDENIQYEDFTLQEPVNGQSLENNFSGISLGENSQCIIINDIQLVDNFNNGQYHNIDQEIIPSIEDCSKVYEQSPSLSKYNT